MVAVRILAERAPRATARDVDGRRQSHGAVSPRFSWVDSDQARMLPDLFDTQGGEIGQKQNDISGAFTITWSFQGIDDPVRRLVAIVSISVPTNGEAPVSRTL